VSRANIVAPEKLGACEIRSSPVADAARRRGARRGGFSHREIGVRDIGAQHNGKVEPRPREIAAGELTSERSLAEKIRMAAGLAPTSRPAEVEPAHQTSAGE